MTKQHTVESTSTWNVFSKARLLAMVAAPTALLAVGMLATSAFATSHTDDPDGTDCTWTDPFESKGSGPNKINLVFNGEDLSSPIRGDYLGQVDIGKTVDGKPNLKPSCPAPNDNAVWIYSLEDSTGAVVPTSSYANLLGAGMGKSTVSFSTSAEGTQLALVDGLDTTIDPCCTTTKTFWLVADWSGEVTDDSKVPLKRKFTISIAPTPWKPPTIATGGVKAETSNSVFLEWDYDVPGTEAEAPHALGATNDGFEVSATASTAKCTIAFGSTKSKVTSRLEGHSSESGEQWSATLGGLCADTSYVFAVRRVSDTGYETNYGTVSNDSSSVRTLANTYTMSNRFKISVGEVVQFNVDTFMKPSTVDDSDSTWDYLRDRSSFNITASSSNPKCVAVEYIDDADSNSHDDVLKLTGMGECTSATITLMGTEMITAGAAGTYPTKASDTLMNTIYVQAIANHSPMFKISEATVDWDVEDTTEAMKFEIDVDAEFVKDQLTDGDTDADCSGDNADASNDANCDDVLEFTLSSTGSPSGTTYLTIDEDTGIISVKPKVTAFSWAKLEQGDQFNLTVTATDAAGQNDSMTIFVDIHEGNDKPWRLNSAKLYENPLTEEGSADSVLVNFASSFSDREGHDLCFAVDTATTKLVDATDSKKVFATASLAGASQCQNGNLTITMNKPSTDPNDPNFALLGHYGVETITVGVKAYEKGDTSGAAKYTLPKVVQLYLVYGPNSAPTIRTVAELTGSNAGTFIASGSHTVKEGANIVLKLTADDPQPSGDKLCWSIGSFCRPCTGKTIGYPKDNPSDSTSGISHMETLTWLGRTYTDYESNNGVTTVSACAADLSGEVARVSFDVNITDMEEKPRISTTRLKDLYMVVGDYSQEVSIVATDGDGNDTITGYGAECVGGCSSAITVSTPDDDGMFTVTPTQVDLKEMTTVEIEVSATDDTGQTAYASFDVTVKNSNQSPSFTDSIAAIAFTMPENAKWGHDLGAPLGVSDTDDDCSDLTASVSGSRKFRASVVRSTCTVQIEAASSSWDYEGLVNFYDFSVTIEDNYGGAASIDAYVDLTDVNEPPVRIGGSTIANQRILVGVTECNIMASDHFMDPDHRDQQAGLYIEASSTRPGDAEVTVVDNNEICITGHNVGSGPSRIKITATDRDDLSVSKTFRVTVEANQDPMVEGDGIPDMIAQEGGRTGDIDLDDYFSDGDPTYDEILEYDFDVDNASVATGALIGGSTLRVYGDMKGEANVTVTATDQNDQSVSDTFMVTVERNDPPVADADAIDDVDTRIGLTEDPIDATGAFSDPGDELTYSIATDDPDVATTALKYDENGGPWILVYSHSPGTTKATMTATDTGKNTADVEFTINVGARNDPPMVANAIDDVELAVGEKEDIDLDDVFDDEGALDIDVTNEDETVADVVHRKSKNEIRVYANEIGETTVSVTATDNVDQSVTDQFTVTVVAAPESVGNIPNQTVQIGGEDLNLSVSEYFAHQENLPMSYAVSTSNSAAKASMGGSQLTLAAYTRGESEVTITATDPRGRSASQTFTTFVSDSELKQVAEQALAGQGRALMSSVSSAIGARLESNRDDTGITFGKYLPLNELADSSTSNVNFAQVADWGTVAAESSSKDVNLNVNSLVSSNFSQTLNGAGGIGSWSLWSATDARNFAGEGYNGSTSTTFLGLDLLANQNWTLGVTASRNTGESTYSWGTATQSMDTSLLSVMPYFSFEAGTSTSVWGVFGVGSGDIVSTVVNADSQSSDLGMSLGMLGGRKAFAKIGNVELAVRGDAGFARLATDSGDGAVDGLSANVNRMRLGLESSTSFRLAGNTVRPFGEIAYRRDGGDGQTGSGVEIGGGVRLATSALTIEARGHMVANHSAKNFSESGFSLKAELVPAADGSGFSFSVAPNWGSARDVGVSSVWTDSSSMNLQSRVEDSVSQGSTKSLDAILGYGFRVGHDRFMVTPFVQSKAENGSESKLMGLEFKQLIQDSRNINLRFAFGRVENGVESDDQFELETRIQF